MWINPLGIAENKLWNEPQADEAKKIIRAAVIFCPEISFALKENQVKVYELDKLTDYKLVCLMDSMNSKELYSLYREGYFYPLDDENKTINLLKFFEKSRGSESKETELDMLSDSFYKYAHENNNVENATKRVNAILPVNNWVELSDQEKRSLVLGDLSKFRKKKFLEGQLWVADLPFYRNYQLLEYIFREKNEYERTYALLKWENEKPIIHALRGTSDVIHDRNSEQEELQLNEGNAIEYLSFFCWAVEGDSGPFLLPKQIQDVPWMSVPDENLKMPEFGTKELDKDDPELAKYPVTENIDFRTKSTVVYDNAIFKAYFQINYSHGLIEMVGDEPLIADLPLKAERFGKNNLTILSKILKDAGSEDKIYFCNKWSEKLAPPVKNSTDREDITAEKFNKLFKNSQNISGYRINGDILVNTDPDGNNQDHSLRVSIANCSFTGEVRILNCANCNELNFENCYFEKGLNSGNNCINPSLYFRNCEFQRCPLEEGYSSLLDVAVNLENLQAGGDVIFVKCRITGRFFSPCMTIKGSFALRGCIISNDYINTPLLFHELNTEIKSEYIENKDYNLGWRIYIGERNSRFSGTIDIVTIDGSRINNNFEFTVAGLNFWPPSQSHDALSTEQLAEKAIATIITGHISAKGISVGGKTDFYGLFSVGGFDMSNSIFSGNVSFASSFELERINVLINGRLDLMNCEIKGNLDLERSQIGGGANLYQITVYNNLGLTGMYAAYLDLNFSKINGMVIVRRQNLRFIERELLELNGNLELSGAQLNVLNLEGILVKGSIIVRTGSFQRFFLTVGLGPGNVKSNKLKPRPCRAYSIELKAIHVQEEIRLSGINLLLPQDLKENKDKVDIIKNDTRNSGCQITGCSIGGNLSFFYPYVLKDLKIKANELVYDKHDTEYYFEDEQEINNVRLPLYKSEIWGDLNLEANKIGGRLDLRNLKVEERILLNDTSIRLDLKMDASYKIITNPNDPYTGLNTTCAELDMEKLECNGDVHLSGLIVEKNMTLVGAKVKGNITFITEDKESASHFAVIKGKLDMTAVHADCVIFSGNINFPPRPEDPVDFERQPTRIKLERGEFNKLEIRKPTPKIDLSKVKVQRWVLGDKIFQSADQYVDILERMHPFDRSTWIDVETNLRNMSLDEEANKIYFEMNKMARKELKNWKDRLENRTNSLITLNVPKFLWVMAIWFIFFITSCIIFSDQRNVDLKKDKTEFTGIDNGKLKNADSYFQTKGNNEILSEFKNDSPLLAGRDSVKAGIKLNQGNFLSGTWDTRDGIILALRYSVPVINLPFNEQWTAGKRKLWNGRLVTAEGFALITTLLSYLALSVILLGITSRLVRGKK